MAKLEAAQAMFIGRAWKRRASKENFVIEFYYYDNEGIDVGLKCLLENLK